MLDLEDDVAEMFSALGGCTHRPDLEGLRVFTSYTALTETPQAVVARMRRWRLRNPERSKAYDASRPKDAKGRYLAKRGAS